MESANREEAKRCLEKAKNRLSRGGTGEAERLVRKSLRLCHTQDAQDFLNQMAARATKSETGHTGESSDGLSSDRARSNSGGGGCETAPRDSLQTQRDYNAEQSNAVKRVLECKDYYEILGVDRDASDADLKKQYKRLALSLHPDKNSAPQSDEAFKAVGNAYSILSDASRRNQYDRFGEDGLRGQCVAAEPDLSADDLFRVFFGDNFRFRGDESFMYGTNGNVFIRRSRKGHHHRHHHQHRDDGGAGMLHICQVLPVVLILLVSLSSSVLQSYFSEPSPFALYKDREYSVKRVTERHLVPYYVKSNFRSEYRGRITSVEKVVIEEYLWELKVRCNNERFSGTRESCKKLTKLKSSIRTS